MAAAPPGWIEAKTRLISTAVLKFDQAGDLSRRALPELLALLDSLDDATAASREILAFVDSNRPSTFWFILNVAIGIGGIAMPGAGLSGLILAAGGTLAAGKCAYDWIEHHVREQRHLGPFHAVAIRKDALKAELLRRGIPLP